jgi:four helix bundle protein
MAIANETRIAARPKVQGPGPKADGLQKLPRWDMARIETFRDLLVWQKSMELTERTYRIIATFPPEERYGLARQMTRASSSIPANLAEGFSRRSRMAYRNHVSIGLGSQAEYETHLELARRLKFISDQVCAEIHDLAQEVGRLLHGLWRALSGPVFCYSWVLFVLSLGPGPWAFGLTNGPLVT